ncbi:hypothetical protein A2382_05020 [Candidatus Woesebacteria bacterium RIFOXYB1_FULL_38_16]|uniref:Uncharacterized protein n=1 Tax=Candidatus Woesebacteria bacterium RIFOXYB1_FULL_38_16 TaxID=1802538 RepID=A0A1F8CWC4_9BACT|nr:MAG: hypothetical protein A2191_00140 [Candidatus Woesebacteria bacterium RIFOXYA1_FULL_38_9]OGM80018.1 MAG: hypothetical protein A2382_05020 [Candidatus Woesebacteria bacterium RIFOXYB1_FULL_38_16]
MEGVQTLLIIVVIALTVLLIVVGMQVVGILLDTRRALRRLNSILDDAIIGGGLISPGKLTGIVEMFRRKKKMQTHGSSHDEPLKEI